MTGVESLPVWLFYGLKLLIRHLEAKHELAVDAKAIVLGPLFGYTITVAGHIPDKIVADANPHVAIPGA